MEELGKGFMALVEIWTQLKDQQGQLTWTTGSYQGLTTNQKAYRSCIRTYGTYVANVQLSLHVSTPKCGTGAILKIFDSL